MLLDDYLERQSGQGNKKKQLKIMKIIKHDKN